jgi:hypothetical protein
MLSVRNGHASLRVGLAMKRHFPSAIPLSMTAMAGFLVAMVLCAPAAAAEMPIITKAQPTPPADPGQFWLDMEYLAWTVSGDKLPALVTTSPVGTPLISAGVLGAPGTSVLFGDSTVNDDWRSGGRVTAGYWFDGAHLSGLETSFFGLEPETTGFNANSANFPILARPFVDATTGLQSSSQIAYPGLLSGSVTASETSRLLGADALYRHDIGVWGSERFSALIGYRFLYASDQLDISSASTVTGGGVIPLGTVLSPSDSFNAKSYFNGLDFGVAAESANGPWSFQWRAELALGANVNQEQINGSTSVTLGGVTTVSSGGLLALSSNIGSYTQVRFAAVPSFSLKAGYQFAPSWQMVAGYDLLYWTDVQRAGKLIDTTINPALIPPSPGGGPQRPQAQFDTSSLLAQGFSVGVKHEF